MIFILHPPEGPGSNPARVKLNYQITAVVNFYLKCIDCEFHRKENEVSGPKKYFLKCFWVQPRFYNIDRNCLPDRRRRREPPPMWTNCPLSCRRFSKSPAPTSRYGPYFGGII
jgi:hypothetical protein